MRDASDRTDDPTPPRVWRVSRATLAAARWTVAAAVAGAGAGAVWGLTWPGADRVTAALLVAAGVAVGLTVWRAAIHPAIVATDDVLVIRNPWQTVTLRWAGVVSVTPATDGITVTSVDSPPVTAWAVQKSNLMIWRGVHRRADEVAQTLQALADERRDGPPPAAPPAPVRAPEPSDAVRDPLPFPWRMSRAEAVVVGFLRHSASPRPMLAAGLLFAVLGTAGVGVLVDELRDSALLGKRGRVVEATVLAVPGLVEVTWPAIRPATVLVETDEEDPTAQFAAGDVVDVLTDPQDPARTRIVGHHGAPWGLAALSGGTLLMASSYLKWWRWLAHRCAPPGRHSR